MAADTLLLLLLLLLVLRWSACVCRPGSWEFYLASAMPATGPAAAGQLLFDKVDRYIGHLLAVAGDALDE